MILPPILILGSALAGRFPASVPADSQPVVVSTEWLSSHLKDRNLVLLHVGERAGYDAGHIPGAQFVAPTTEWSTPRVEGQLFLELPSPAILDSAFEARGISDDSRIVLYAADQYFTPTSRALFTLEYAGLKGQVSILDGGLPAWKSEGRPTSTEVPQPARGRFTPRPDPSMVVDAAFVAAHLTDPKVRIIDARDSAFYNGRETRQGRNGHIPGAANVPFQTIVDSSGHFRSLAVLKTQFINAGARDGQTVVTYCHIGQQASLVWFGARLAGYPARLYDGSFQDWAMRKELPVEGDRKP